MVEAKKAELEIEQKIAKETAELTKALNLRQEGMRELAIHRSRAKEDKRMLMEEKKVGVGVEWVRLCMWVVYVRGVVGWGGIRMYVGGVEWVRWCM